VQIYSAIFLPNIITTDFVIMKTKRVNFFSETQCICHALHGNIMVRTLYSWSRGDRFNSGLSSYYAMTLFSSRIWLRQTVVMFSIRYVMAGPAKTTSKILPRLWLCHLQTTFALPYH